MIINKKNTVRSILENLNEARTINIGGGSVAYQYDGKYYIKKGNSKKEISSDQYQKLLKMDTDLRNPKIDKETFSTADPSEVLETFTKKFNMKAERNGQSFTIYGDKDKGSIESSKSLIQDLNSSGYEVINHDYDEDSDESTYILSNPKISNKVIRVSYGVDQLSGNEFGYADIMNHK